MPFVAKYQSGICPNCGKGMNPGELLTVRGRGRPSQNGSGRRTYMHVDCGTPLKTPPAIQRESLTVAQAVTESVSAPFAPSDELSAIRAEIAEMKRQTAQELEQVKRAAIKSVVVTVNNGDQTHTIDVGLQHENFPMLLALMSGLEPAERNIWLTGPAGSGKTTAARKLAEALGVPFYFTGAIDSPYKLTGFMDAKGAYVQTAFYQAVKYGGVFLFDEVDGSLAGAVLEFQAFLATGFATFPNEPMPVERHPNCYIVAAANTWGFGGDANYVGRLKLDAAFLDRFVTLEWDYDNKLERALSGNDAWVTVVQSVRQAARDGGIQVVISPRASMKGAQLLRSGMSPADVVKAVFGRYRGHNNWPTFGKTAEDFARSGAASAAPASAPGAVSYNGNPVNSASTFRPQPEIDALPTRVQEQIVEEYILGNKVAAVRLLREATDFGLYDAKVIIDRAWGNA